jgi:hypothetical protein
MPRLGFSRDSRGRGRFGGLLLARVGDSHMRGVDSLGFAFAPIRPKSLVVALFVDVHMLESDRKKLKYRITRAAGQEVGIFVFCVRPV